MIIVDNPNIGIYLSPGPDSAKGDSPASGLMMVVDTDSNPSQDPPVMRAMVGLSVVPDTMEQRIRATVADRVGCRPGAVEATVQVLDDGRTKITVTGDPVTDYLIPV